MLLEFIQNRNVYILFGLPTLIAQQNELQREELEALSLKASDGVIHFTPQMFDDYVTGKRRPYALIVFCTASHLLDKQQLNLRGLRKEFGLLATVIICL